MSKIVKRNWPAFILLTLAIGAGIWLRPKPVRAAANYYVSTAGTGTTCSLGTPCKLITAWCGGECSAFAPVSGDTVWIIAGDYKLTVGGNGGRGSSSTPMCNHTNGVTYRNYQNGKVTIDMNVDMTVASQCTGAVGTFASNSPLLGNNTFWGLIFYNSNTNYSRIGPAPDARLLYQNEFILSSKGSRIINSFFFDSTDGVLKNAGNSGVAGGGNLIRGTVEQYSGFIFGPGSNTVRGAGHSIYIKNSDIDGEVGRSTVDGNIGLRAMEVGTQFYSTTDQISYITMQNSIEAAQGICSGTANCADPSSWPAVACCANTFYLGTSGTVNSRTPHVIGSKDWYQGVFTGNWAIGGSTGLTLGGSKGVQDSIVTNNQFITTGGQAMTCTGGAGFYLPFTLTGNTFYAPLNGGGCPAPALTLANYPSNTVNAGFPTSGYLTKAWVSPDEVGRGWYAVVNWGDTANVTIDLDAMGGYAGEQYRIQNWQDLDPWDASKDVTTGTCGATCGTLSVSATATSIRQPAFTRLDGTTPFPKPVDLGPRYVVFYLYPRWEAGAGTPTPTVTNTPVNTATRTNTPTSTSTPTGAPTFTPSPTNTNNPTNTPTFTPSQTPTVTPTPTIFSTSFEAETCQITAPMRSVSDSAASGGFYIDSTVSGSAVPANGGNILCTFTVPATATYRVWLRVMAPDATQDSMYVSYNGEAVTNSTHIMDMGENQDCTTSEKETLWGSNYAWRKLDDRSQNCSPSVSGAGAVGWERATTVGSGVGGQLLSSGTNTLTFYGREVGARLDYVIITSDMSYNPNGGNPTPTPTPGVTSHSHRCNGKIGWHSHPNSGPHRHVPCPWK